MIGMIFVWPTWYVLTFTLLTLGGVAQSGFSTMQSAVTMLATPHDMRGRMMGLLSVCIGAGTPLGAFEMGLVASAFSIQWAIALNAFAGLLLLVPAIMFTPLPWKPLIQVEPADLAETDVILEPGSSAGDS